MPSPTELIAEPEPFADDMEMRVEMSDDDDFDYDESDEEQHAANEHRSGSPGNIPVWRLIEMSREDRFLKRELADFEDYDSYDRYTDDFVGLPH